MFGSKSTIDILLQNIICSKGLISSIPINNHKYDHILENSGWRNPRI